MRPRTYRQEKLAASLLLSPMINVSEFCLFYPQWNKCKTTDEAGMYIEKLLKMLKKRKEERRR